MDGTGPDSQSPRARVVGRSVAFVTLLGMSAGALALAALPEVGATSAVVGASRPQAIAAGTSAGCGTKAAPGPKAMSLSISGHARTVITYAPPGYSGTKALALVLNMHGSGTTALDQELFTGMDATAAADGFIVAYPQGLIPEGTGFDWNVPGVPLVGGASVPAGAANDVTFLTALVGVLEHDYCVDPQRVYATGFSGGARMASQLACDASTVFAAVAPVSGLRHPNPCPAKRAVPVLAFHGTADPVDPFAGHGQAYWTYSVAQAASEWSTQDGCAKSPQVTRPDAELTLDRYYRCRTGAVVDLYAITGEGHEWPDGPTLSKRLTDLLGPQSDAINANGVMYAFFTAHPMVKSS